MQYIAPKTNAVYSGDRAHWQDIELTTERPTQFHYPIIEDGAFVGWELNQAELMQAKQIQLDEEVQARMDAFAQTRQYDSMDRLCSYANSTLPQWAAEGQRGIQLRDNTWAKATMILNEVVGGSRPVPESIEDIEDELPELSWGDI